jgi:hypothetical protein
MRMVMGLTCGFVAQPVRLRCGHIAPDFRAMRRGCYVAGCVERYEQRRSGEYSSMFAGLGLSPRSGPEALSLSAQ